MMNIEFNNYYTSSTLYSGNAEGYKFITEVTYSSLEKKWSVLETRWLFGSPEDKDRAEKRIKKLVKEFFQKDNDTEEVSALYERIFKEDSLGVNPQSVIEYENIDTLPEDKEESE